MSILNDPSASGAGDGFVNDINMTPLIDVMLVLLIVFIITLPVMNQAVKVALPKATAQAVDPSAKDIDVSITADGTVLWNRTPVDAAELAARIAAAAAAAGGAQPPAVNVYADEAVPYGRVAKLLASVQAGGLSRINFVTDPPGAPATASPAAAAR
ncbi:ExbD/TolR family protein [Burkholderia sp. Ac-20379]|uniref:ExbD/TolR family protein n=1 Tax=Burkholderia sp. Ac-20379 TaxID=2703900 RepID=UPI00197E1852|nr:biopolymer transporter ExbD [Burkholderia sp. Ac-20379]MBN3725227.1 biopolymer transporter ExbD [Burkholderia sp. Ac-20379]